MDGIAEIDHLAELRRQLDGFAACLEGDLSTPIEHCGGWTLYDLVDHMGRGNQWATMAVKERRGDHRGDPAPRDAGELTAWFTATAAGLLAALEAEPSTPAWTFAPPRTVGFWRRRRCLETVIHRWDAENALGTPGDIDPAVAADGVAEVFDTMVPRQMARGRLSLPARPVRFMIPDNGGSWVLGDGEPEATVTAAAPHLLLLLWGRLALTAPSIDVRGDHEAARLVVAGHLTP